MNNLGASFLSQQDAGSARVPLEEAVSLSARLPTDLVTADIYNNLAGVYKNSKDYLRALRYIRESLVIRDRMGDFSRTPLTLLHLAGIGIDLGEYRNSTGLLAARERAMETLGYAPSHSGSYHECINEAQCHLSKSEFDAAWDFGAAVAAEESVSMALRAADQWLDHRDPSRSERRQS